MTDQSEVELVETFWGDLGLPGLLDLHVHFLPPPIERAVWREFDQGGELIGRSWPITYRHSQEERVELLRSFGVRRFPTLPYAHKPGAAEFLNGWSREFAAGVPEALWTATFFPEDGVTAYVAGLIDAGVEMFKVHSQVGSFHVDDPLLDAAWGLIADAGVPVVAHVGSGPVGTPYTGPAATARLLRRHPGLRLVIAHLGMPEAADFIALAETHDHVHLDTSMALAPWFLSAARDERRIEGFTDPHGGGGAFPADLVPRLGELQHRVVYGSDFPTLPFRYADQLGWIADLGLGDDWLRDVCWHNAARLLGI
ncbi:MAG TPA: amidohydrolase family protein [Nocardioides sp.]|nr:amidohydrolase family protein [Nocardioides sp.]